jgi:uncharacterized protein
VELLQGFPGPLLLPAPLITEIGYMLYSRAAVIARDKGCARPGWRPAP